MQFSSRVGEIRAKLIQLESRRRRIEQKEIILAAELKILERSPDILDRVHGIPGHRSPTVINRALILGYIESYFVGLTSRELSEILTRMATRSCHQLYVHT